MKKEAGWAIANATAGGSSDQMKFLVHCHCLPAFCQLLECQDVRVMSVSLEALENILKIGAEDQRIALSIGQEGVKNIMCQEILKLPQAVSTIEMLQQHPNNEVVEKAGRILVYFASSF